MPEETAQPEDSKQKNLPTTSPDAAAQARAQAEAYDSVFAPTVLQLDENTTITLPPHPNVRMLDDDKLAAYEALLFEVETEYERGPDTVIPEQKVYDKGGNVVTTLPPTTRPGPLLEPHRRKNADGKVELVTPPYAVRVVKTVLGEDDYALLRAAGKSSSDVWKIWNRQSLDIAERQSEDSKSDGSAVDLAPVPSPDSERPVEVPSASDS